MEKLNEEVMKKYSDRFPAQVPDIGQLSDTEEHRIQLIDASKTIKTRSYPCPQKYREAWRKLLDEHLKYGRFRESSSPYASPLFLIPKPDPKAPRRWVCDFRGQNANTVKDRTPLPRIDEILNDCARGRYFAKIDMTNAFFQTRM